jgi:hypothetical protein
MDAEEIAFFEKTIPLLPLALVWRRNLLYSFEVNREDWRVRNSRYKNGYSPCTGWWGAPAYMRRGQVMVEWECFLSQPLGKMWSQLKRERSRNEPQYKCTPILCRDI